MGVLELTLGPARVVWTDRHGGTSAPPYESANLAHHVGDDATRVDENRARIADALGIGDPTAWRWLRQVHGSTVVDVARGAAASSPREADAAVTTDAGVALTVLTADCAPIALACDDAIAVVHAGWPGLLLGVIEAAVDRLRTVGHGAVHAALGPCIHPGRYEFGDADLARMVDHLGPEVASRTEAGAPALDVPAAVRAALRRAGVTSLEDAGICTSASPDHFSYRRDGPTGRQALVAVIEA
jgi:YfiH family protein